jgi:hypothetical protein
MLDEMIDVVKHECQKIMRWMVPGYPFISNEELIRKISTKLRQTRSSSVVKIHRLISDFHRITLNSFYEINLESGVRIDAESMQKILKGLSLVQEKILAMEHDADKYLNNALADIMVRFGSPAVHNDLDVRDEQYKAFLESAKLETMKRVAQLQLDVLNKSLQQLGQGSTEVKLQRRVLRAVVQKARHLPRMDFGRGVDVFCALFVEGGPGLFQTEILRGSCESDWTWGESESFSWDLGPASSNEVEGRKLVVMVYDKDQVSSDDVIGCVTVRLADLQHGTLDDWREIIRPQGSFFPNHTAKRNEDQPEVKLKVWLEYCLADSGLTSGYSEPAGKSPSASSIPVSMNGDFASSSSLVLCPPNLQVRAIMKTP